MDDITMYDGPLSPRENLRKAARQLEDIFEHSVHPFKNNSNMETLWTAIGRYAKGLADYLQCLFVVRGEFERFRNTQKYRLIQAHTIVVRTMIESLLIQTQQMTREEWPELPENPYDIFLGHAGEQKEELIRPLFNELGGHPRVFFDDSSHAFKTGGSIKRTILAALSSCSVGFVLISKESLSKEWPLFELLILSSRIAMDEPNDFQLVLAPRIGTDAVPHGWSNWFEAVSSMPLCWPNDSMPATCRLDEKPLDDHLQTLVEEITQAVSTTSEDTGRLEEEEEVPEVDGLGRFDEDTGKISENHRAGRRRYQLCLLAILCGAVIVAITISLPLVLTRKSSPTTNDPPSIQPTSPVAESQSSSPSMPKDSKKHPPTTPSSSQPTTTPSSRPSETPSTPQPSLSPVSLAPVPLVSGPDPFGNEYGTFTATNILAFGVANPGTIVITYTPEGITTDYPSRSCGHVRPVVPSTVRAEHIQWTEIIDYGDCPNQTFYDLDASPGSWQLAGFLAGGSATLVSLSVLFEEA